MSTATQTNTTEGNALDAALRLQGMSLDELKAEAQRLGVQLQTTDKADIINEMISAATAIGTDAKPGMLVSLHSRTAEAEEIVLAARNVIVQNKAAGKYFNLFLKNQKGSFYTQRVPGCRLTPERIADVLNAVQTLPDGSQETLVQQLRDHPEAFQDTWLVLMTRFNATTQKWNSFVMLYLREKQEVIEKSF